MKDTCEIGDCQKWKLEKQWYIFNIIDQIKVYKGTLWIGHFPFKWKVEGRKGERTNGWKDERTKGWKDVKGRKDERMKGRKDERMKGWKDERMKGWKDERMKGWKYERMKVCMGGHKTRNIRKYDQ